MEDLPEDVQEIRDKELSPAEVAKATAPKKTWFVKRLTDGYVFACEAREAWDIINNKSTWKLSSRDFKFIGCSDGKTYARIAKELMAEANALAPQIEQMKKEIGRYRAQEDRFLMDEVVDMEGDASDEVNEANKQKVLRLRKIIDRETEKLEALEAKHRDATKNVVQRAFDAERAVAEENWQKNGPEWPPAMNIITPEARNPQERQEIVNMLGGGRR